MSKNNEDVPINIIGEAENAIEKIKKKFGKVNILIAGKTGVGKSTLINAMFNDDTIAKIGEGKPVTDEITVKEKKGIPIAIIDTKGLEIEKYDEIIKELQNYIEMCNNYNDINKQIHIAWVCIAEPIARYEDAEKELIDMLLKFKIPVIVVITKTLYNENFIKTIKELCPYAKGYVNVRAKSMEIEGHVYQSKNLEVLAKITNNNLPEAIQEAFIRTQKVSLDLKIIKSWTVVATSSASAAAIGAISIPISDYPLIIGVEIAMLGSISYIFGLNLDKKIFVYIISTVFGISGSAFLGKTIVTNLMKLIPGLNIVGSIISGATAASITTTIGGIYITALKNAFNNSEDGKIPTQDEIKASINKIKSKGFSEEEKKIFKESIQKYRCSYTELQDLNQDNEEDDIFVDCINESNESIKASSSSHSNDCNSIYDYSSIINETIKSFRNDLGKINIIIAGKTGTGKSTLINAIFHEDLATTGFGKPITQETKEITKDGLPISIYDTKGLEIEAYSEIIDSLSEFIKKKRNKSNVHEHIHVAWVCIAENSARFEEAEKELINMLLNYEIPVIVVITKTLYDEHFIDVVKKLCPRANGYINVRAKQIKIEGNIYKLKNLEKLVELTNKVLPEGVNNAFTASQKVLLELKNIASTKIIEEFTYKANKATRGKLLIPFTDSEFIISLEIEMLIAISGVFGLNIRNEFMNNIVKTIFGNENKLSLKQIILNLLKLIPGVNIVVATFSGKYVSELIKIVGNIYTSALYNAFLNKKGEIPLEIEIITNIIEEKEKYYKNKY